GVGFSHVHCRSPQLQRTGLFATVASIPSLAPRTRRRSRHAGFPQPRGRKPWRRVRSSARVGIREEPMDQPSAGEPHSAMRWYALAVFTLGYALNIADRYVVSTLIEPIKAEMGLSD